MRNPRKIIIVAISISIGLLHFIIGPDYQGPFRNFFLGYLIDILLPFSLYLLMGLFDQPIIKNAYFRGVFIFSIGLIVEILQYNGVKIFGNTADIYDLIAYASGIILAGLFEYYILSKTGHPSK